MFNYIYVSEFLNNIFDYNFIYINNSFIFKINYILKILSFTICNKKFINLYQNKENNIFAWVLENKYNRYFF